MADEKLRGNALFVAIVEDDDETRARIAASIATHPELRLAAQYATGREAIAGLALSAPDVLLVDLGLPDISGLEVIRFATAHHPHCDVLVVSIFGEEEHVIPALEAGAGGFLLKGALTRDITFDIQELRNGGSPLSPIIARQVLKRLRPRQPPPAAAPDKALDGEDALTPREIEILRTIARGFSYAETAELLGISVQTVHTHLKRLYRKLAVHSKTEAVFEADQRNLL
jgi:DNA-binding NarL/FixJ family response regulator